VSKQISFECQSLILTLLQCLIKYIIFKIYIKKILRCGIFGHYMVETDDGAQLAKIGLKLNYFFLFCIWCLCVNVITSLTYIPFRNYPEMILCHLTKALENWHNSSIYVFLTALVKWLKIISGRLLNFVHDKLVIIFTQHLWRRLIVL